MNKNILLSSVLVLACAIAGAQNFTSISEAFNRSYSYEKEGKYKEAFSELDKVYDAASYEINLRMGYLDYMIGTYAESMEYYQKAIDLKPYAIEAHFGYVLPASATGNWNEVESHYKSILSIDPQNTKANYWIGMIYYNREQYDVAMKHFEQVANLYPFDYDGTIMYAWTSFKLNNLRQAKILFQKALLIRPGDSSALEGLSLIQ